MVLDRCRKGKLWCWTGLMRGRDVVGHISEGEWMILDRCREGMQLLKGKQCFMTGKEEKWMVL